MNGRTEAAKNSSESGNYFGWKCIFFPLVNGRFFSIFFFLIIRIVFGATSLLTTGSRCPPSSGVIVERV